MKIPWKLNYLKKKRKKNVGKYPDPEKLNNTDFINKMP